MIYLCDDISGFDFESALALVTTQRRQQAMRYYHDADRRLSVAAYLMLCMALKNEYGIGTPPVFRYSETGKPYIEGHEDILFSLSHCHGAVLCAVDNSPVGCDIENFSGIDHDLVRATMSPAEQQTIYAAGRPEEAFLRLWTQKESLLKLTGEGIRDDMTSVLQDSRLKDGTLRFDTRAADNYVFSVCSARPLEIIKQKIS